MARWRAFARAAIFLGLVFFTASVSAGTVVVLAGGIPILIQDAAEILGGVFAVIMGFMAFSALFTKLFVLPVTNGIAAKHEAMISEGLAEIGRGFEALMTRHVDSGDPHPVATHELHLPFKEGLAALKHEVDRVADRSEEIAAAYAILAARCPANGCDDPLPSLAPRHRHNLQVKPDESGDDFTAMRKT